MPVRFELPFTQTSHVVALACTLLIAVSLSFVGRLELQKEGLVPLLVRLAHLAAFASWLGTQLWVGFVAGEPPEVLLTSNVCSLSNFLNNNYYENVNRHIFLYQIIYY